MNFECKNIERYYKLVRRMASNLDLTGKHPNMWDDDFREAVICLLNEDNKIFPSVLSLFLKEKEKEITKNNIRKINACLEDQTIIKSSYELLVEIIAKYIIQDEESDEKEKLAVLISNNITKKIILYYRNQIEEDVHDLYDKEYFRAQQFGDFDQVPY